MGRYHLSKLGQIMGLRYGAMTCIVPLPHHANCRESGISGLRGRVRGAWHCFSSSVRIRFVLGRLRGDRDFFEEVLSKEGKCASLVRRNYGLGHSLVCVMNCTLYSGPSRINPLLHQPLRVIPMTATVLSFALALLSQVSGSWQIVTSAEGNFTVAMPVKPTLSSSRTILSLIHI